MATGDVKEVRRRLKELAVDYPEISDRLLAILPFTQRDRYKLEKPAKANRKSDGSLRDEEIKAIIHFALDHPEVEHRAIGRRFRVDGGRVSEFLGSMGTERLQRLRREVAQERGMKRWE